jgi:hypothetical protein
VLSKKENFLTEKILFLGGKIFGHFLKHLFEISAKIVVLLISLADNFKEIYIFSTLIRGGGGTCFGG